MEINTEIKQKEKFTYLIFDGQKYKIGRSNNPDERLKSIKTGNPDAVLLAKTDKIEEKFLHTYFYKKRVGGEWFNLNEDDLEKIKDFFDLGNDWRDELVTKLRRGKIDAEKKYRSYIIPFGKYKGRKIMTMLAKEELKYVAWLLGEMDQKLSKRAKRMEMKYKAFNWWWKNCQDYLEEDDDDCSELPNNTENSYSYDI